MLAAQKLIESRYYQSALNQAIFDGPFHIYFSDRHEPDALKIFNHLKGEFTHIDRDPTKIFKQNIFIMIYPNAEIHTEIIGNKDGVAVEEFMGCPLLAVPVPLTETTFDQLMQLLSAEVAEFNFSQISIV